MPDLGVKSFTAPTVRELPSRFPDGRRISEVSTTVAGIPMSALVAPVATPRGVIVAIHGGGSGATYFDGSTRDDQSLVALGQRLGFTVVALDRPGYGASAGHFHHISVDEQVNLVSALIDAILSVTSPHRDGIVVVAHSAGTQISCHLAARRTDVVGLETSGSAMRYKTRAGSSSIPDPDAWSTPGAVRTRIWGSPALYPPGTFDDFRATMTQAPDYEVGAADGWPARYAGVAQEITAPVRITMAEFEDVWSTLDSDMAELAAAYTRAPRVVVHRQADAGHNISLGWTARAYHLGVLAFAEECYERSRRTTATSTRSSDG